MISGEALENELAYLAYSEARELKSAPHVLNIPVIYRLGTKWIGHIPTFLSYALSDAIATASYVFCKSAVRNAQQNLSLVCPHLPDRELRAMSRRLFRNYGRYLVDYGRCTNLSPRRVLENIVSFQGKENLEVALRMGKGLILLTAHLGNWELGGIFFGNYGAGINVVTFADSNPEIDRIRMRYREKHRVNTITIGDSPFSTLELLSALNRGEIVALLVDRYRAGPESLTMDFFNKPTFFPRGPSALSRLTGAPLVVAFVVKEGKGYRGIVEEPFVVTDEEEEDEAIGRVVKMLEKYIMVYPDQWYNFTPV